MKKFLLLFFTIFKLTAFAQDANNPSKYVGKTMVPIRPDSYDEDKYFLLKRIQKYPYKANLLYPAKMKYSTGYGYKSAVDSIMGKTFECKNAGKYDEYDYYLELYSASTGTFFYKYLQNGSPLFKSTEELKAVEDAKIAQEENKRIAEKREIDSIKAETEKYNAAEKIEKENPCRSIREEYDEVEREKRISTTFTLPDHELARQLKINHTLPKDYNTQITKIIKNGVQSYYISMKTVAVKAAATQKGIIILLANGKRIVKPTEEVETDVEDSEFVRSAFVKLTAADLLLLKSSPMSKFKLYDTTADVDASERIYKQFLCLLTRK